MLLWNISQTSLLKLDSKHGRCMRRIYFARLILKFALGGVMQSNPAVESWSQTKCPEPWRVNSRIFIERGECRLRLVSFALLVA